MWHMHVGVVRAGSQPHYEAMNMEE